MQGTTHMYLIISGLIFGVVSIIHLVRAVNEWTFVIGPMTLPVAVSWLGFLVTATLGVWAFRLVAGGV